MLEDQWALPKEPRFDEVNEQVLPHAQPPSRQLRQLKLLLPRKTPAVSTPQPHQRTCTHEFEAIQRLVAPSPAPPTPAQTMSLPPPPPSTLSTVPPHLPSTVSFIPAMPSSTLARSPPRKQSCGHLPPQPMLQPSNHQGSVSLKVSLTPSPERPPTTPSVDERPSDVMQSTPSVDERPSDVMQSTPCVDERPSDVMQSTLTIGVGFGKGIVASHLKENIALNGHSRWVWHSARLQRAERRPADGGRTPSRDEGTPQRGREHPLSTPSPTYLGTGGMHGVLEDQAQCNMALHELTCSLFGSPLISSQGSHLSEAKNEKNSRDQHTLAHSSPGPSMYADQWACAACTLLNDSTATRCAVCDALKGSTLASAATLALQRTNRGARGALPNKITAGEAGNSRTAARAITGRARSVPQPARIQTDITSFFNVRP